MSFSVFKKKKTGKWAVLFDRQTVWKKLQKAQTRGGIQLQKGLMLLKTVPHKFTAEKKKKIWLS